MAKSSDQIGNAIRATVATKAEHFAHAVAVRSICFMEERGLSFNEEFDGNDFQSTHTLLYDGDDPVGASRIRWFNGFARIERTAIRQSHRKLPIIRYYSAFIDAHVARRGYPVLVTVAEDTYARLWERMFGFKRVPGRVTRKPGQTKPYYEMMKRLEVPSNALSQESDMAIMFRTEGEWDVPAAFG